MNKVKPFIDQYNWKDINFPFHVVDWKKFELNNKSITLNVLYVPVGDKTIRHEMCGYSLFTDCSFDKKK